jgi:hypothetical protein
LQSGSTEFQIPQSGIIRLTLQLGSIKFLTRPSEVLFSNLTIKKKKEEEKNPTIRKFSKKRKVQTLSSEKKKKKKPIVKKDEIKK